MAQYSFSSASTQFMTVTFFFFYDKSKCNRVIDTNSTKHNYTFQKKTQKKRERDKDVEIKKQYLVDNDR